MAENQSYDLGYIVYEIVKTGAVRAFENAYSLIHVKSFQDEADAQNWIIDEGERQVNYTVLPVYRKK